MEAAIGAEYLPHECEEPDAPDNGQHGQRKQADAEYRAAPIRHRRQGDERQAAKVEYKANAHQAEAEHARGQHDAERQQQHGGHAENEVGQPQPQPCQHGRALFAALRRRVKLRRKRGRVAQLRGDLLLRVAVRKLKGKVLLILLRHVGGVLNVSFFSARP